MKTLVLSGLVCVSVLAVAIALSMGWGPRTSPQETPQGSTAPDPSAVAKDGQKDVNAGSKLTEPALKAIEKLKILGGKVEVENQDGILVILDGTKIGDDDLGLLKDIPTLTKLSLSNTKITDAGLVHFRGLSNLQSLNLRQTAIGDEGLTGLKGLAQLQELNLDGTRTTDAGLGHLTVLTKLQSLNLCGTKITDKGLGNINRLTDLHTFSLAATPISDAGLAQISGLTNLKYLDLYGTRTTDVGLALVSHFTKLEWLNLDSTRITDAGLIHISKLSKLESLRLLNTDIGDIGLTHIKGLTSLKDLELSNTKITDACTVHLKALPNLMTLRAVGTQFTYLGIERLRQPPTEKSGTILTTKDLPKNFTSSIGMKFAWIPPGSFIMGSPVNEEGRSETETQHRVTLTKGFYVSVYPVTQQQWQAVMGNNPSNFKGDTNLPVERVSWNDCQEFAYKLRERDRKMYRLPSEAEWEYACRAGTKTPFHFGDTIAPDQANYNCNFVYGKGKKGAFREKTTPVGSFPANAWGLHDMHGNVWEWCQDLYGDYPARDVVDPQGAAKGDSRVLRGGSWFRRPENCRSALRFKYEPGFRSFDFGFRLCFSVPTMEEEIALEKAERERLEAVAKAERETKEKAKAEPQVILKITGEPSKVYMVKLTEGKTYHIAVDRRSDWDEPFCRIEDSTGKKLAEDRNGGGFLFTVERVCGKWGTVKTMLTAQRGPSPRNVVGSFWSFLEAMSYDSRHLGLGGRFEGKRLRLVLLP